MVLVDSDDDEERKLLLSESPSLTNSPVITKELVKEAARGSWRQQEAKEARKHQLLPRLAWTTGPSMEADKLRLGAAEEQFLAMTGGGSDGCDDDNDDDKDDDDNKVPDSLQVVSSILSELDADILSERPSESNQPDTCTCALPQHKLIVDVHSQGGVTSVVSAHNVSGGRCREHGKHTTDRVAAGAGAVRCHTETDRQLAVAATQHRNDQLDNCDRIETVGEERSRHMSESALGPLHWSLGRRKRAATLCTSPRTTAETVQARQSAISNATNISGLDFGSGLDIVKHCRSTDTLGGEVKFDIWEEADLEMEEGALDNLEGRSDVVDGGLGCDPAIRGLQEELDSAFPQHPLVTELYNCYNSVPGMSHSSSTSSMPICRICQLPSLEPHNSLISPCRCLGSIRYVHNPCLAKWLEVCSRKTGDPPVCELCQYQYIRHKKFVISNWRVPSISSKDRVLHSVFLLSILVMIVCSVATILSFKQADTLPKVGPDTELSSSELLTLSCGVFFFFSFFVAMYVEVKAEYTIYQLICKFFQMNHEWTILEYDRARDRIKKDTFGIKGSFP